MRRAQYGGMLFILIVLILSVGCGGTATEEDKKAAGSKKASTAPETVAEKSSETTMESTGDEMDRGVSEDAIVLASRQSREPEISSAKTKRIEDELRSIREEYPRLKEIHARPTFVLNELLVGLTEEASWREGWSEGEVETGNSGLDDLLAEYNIEAVKATSPTDGTYPPEIFLLTFERPLNTESLAGEIESASKEVRYAEPNRIRGDGDDIVLKQRSTKGSKTYVFSEGSGDCLAGCIERSYWTVTLDEDGKMSLEESMRIEGNGRKEPATPRTTS